MKKILTIAFAIPFVLSLSACGKSEEKSAIEKIKAGKEETLTESEVTACKASEKCLVALDASEQATPSNKVPKKADQDHIVTGKELEKTLANAPSYGADDL